MPTLTAATLSRKLAGTPAGRSLATACKASTRARKPPVMLKVRVPPSASSTSQSMVTVRSPMAARSITARRLRPIRR